MNEEEEVWKDIPDYEGYYQASNFGRIRSLDREVAGKAGSVQVRKGRVLKPELNKSGYLLVMLSKNSKHKMFSIHRLVYSAFYGSISEDYEVNHIDEDKTNNRLENLNLMTRKENNNWGTHNQRVAKALSKPVVAIDDSGNIALEFLSANEAGRNGFNQGHLSACCLGERRTHRGYRWKFKEDIENA